MAVVEPVLVKQTQTNIWCIFAKKKKKKKKTKKERDKIVDRDTEIVMKRKKQPNISGKMTLSWTTDKTNLNTCKKN